MLGGNMSQTDEKQGSVGAKALNVVALIGGAAVGQYAGISLLIPLFLTSAVWWLAKRFLPEHKKLVLPTFSIQCGHGLWMSLGFALLGTINLNIMDIVLLAGGLLWLLAKPSRGPLFLLGAYQLLAGTYNGYLFYEAAVGSSAHKALLVHIIWRVLALFFTAQLFMKLRKPDTRVIVVP